MTNKQKCNTCGKVAKLVIRYTGSKGVVCIGPRCLKHGAQLINSLNARPDMTLISVAVA